jgi:hypothetical protein
MPGRRSGRSGSPEQTLFNTAVGDQLNGYLAAYDVRFGQNKYCAGVKALGLSAIYGTTEVVPFQNRDLFKASLAVTYWIHV